jgi:KUP system potassium uptake protein
MKSAASLPTAVGAAPARRRTTVSTTLAALGIVFGDLGTSPLYTYQTMVGSVGGHASVPVAMGLLSLVVWSLIITVSLKYCVFVMRADNHGEGGILALMALVTSSRPRSVERGDAGCHGIVRGGPALRRRHHHASNLGPERT